MNLEKLLQSSTPINRTALRVIRPAKKEDVWLPKPKIHKSVIESSEVIRIREIPESAREKLSFLIGMKRGHFTIIGYASDQPAGDTARWVVRCVCGNYACRTRIIRWLGTACTDMCSECAHRNNLIGRDKASKNPAERKTRIEKVAL